MNLHGVCYGEGDLSCSYLVFEFPSNGCLRPRLHRNTIFGVVSMSDTCQTPERVRIARFRCSVSVLFFFFFSLHASTWSRRVRNASNEGKRRRKSQILSLRSHFEKPTSQSSQPTLALTFVAALYPSLELDRADRRAP